MRDLAVGHRARVASVRRGLVGLQRRRRGPVAGADSKFAPEFRAALFAQASALVRRFESAAQRANQPGTAQSRAADVYSAVPVADRMRGARSHADSEGGALMLRGAARRSI